MSIEEKITLGIAVVTGVKWVYEYTKKLTWDKNIFLLERFEKFKSKETTKAMHLILDMLFESFETHDVKKTFTQDESVLRKMFDEYFDDLNEFRLLSETGIISEKNYRLYMKYWFQILNGEKLSKKQRLRDQIKKYMNYYGFEELYEFIGK